MSEAILSYQKTGNIHTETYDSPSDAMDRGVALLVSHEGSPLHVKVNGYVVADKNDMFLMWEQEMKSRAA